MYSLPLMVQFGYAPLHKAAEGGHVGVAELLLKYGARVDITKNVRVDTYYR